MEEFAVGDVVLVSFPFSNLKGKKIRPALLLARVEFDNFILCQITSKSYSSRTAVNIKKSDFIEGSLPVASFVRPDKLFTADTSILTSRVGVLRPAKKKAILKKVRTLFM